MPSAINQPPASPSDVITIQKTRYEHLLRCESELIEARDLISLLQNRLKDYDESK